VQTDAPDQLEHLGLGAAHAEHPPARAQTTRDHRQVEQERAVGEVERAHVDEQVQLHRERARERGTAEPLRGEILVTGAQQRRGLSLERDDGAESYLKRGGYTRGMPTVEDVEDALSNVIDPELGLDFVELGLIYGIEVDAGHVHVTFTLTSPGCPIGPQVSEQIEEFVGELEGVDSVDSSMVFQPPWTPDKMSEDAKFALGF
jgi:metal-sulfur cluster biosynthetic enzyme